MDHRESKPESDHNQTASTEIPNSNPSKEESLKEVSQDQASVSSVGEENTNMDATKSLKTSEAAADADPEWKQFVQQELESTRNPETARQAAQNQTATPKSLESAIGFALDKVPFERLIESSVRYFMKKRKERLKAAKKAKKRGHRSRRR
jgi:hypothetical protein